MDKLKVKNGTKLLINNQVYVVMVVVMHTLYVKHVTTSTDYDFTEDEISRNYRIEFLKE